MSDLNEYELGSGETLRAQGAFGAVTSKRVIFNAAKGRVGKRCREDIAIGGITSVRIEWSRQWIPGLLLLLLSIPGLLFLLASVFDALTGIGMPIGLLLFGLVTGPPVLSLALFFLVSRPTVCLNTSGNDARRSVGRVVELAEAEAFVRAIRQAILER